MPLGSHGAARRRHNSLPRRGRPLCVLHRPPELGASALLGVSCCHPTPAALCGGRRRGICRKRGLRRSHRSGGSAFAPAGLRRIETPAPCLPSSAARAPELAPYTPRRPAASTARCRKRRLTELERGQALLDAPADAEAAAVRRLAAARRVSLPKATGSPGASQPTTTL